MYSPDSLMADQTEGVEKALWAAMRSMEEQAEFSERLATNSRQKKRAKLARRFSEKAQTNRQNAALLRDLLQRSADTGRKDRHGVEIFPEQIPRHKKAARATRKKAGFATAPGRKRSESRIRKTN
jgi:hypothetical protein